ncbi:hypothetical protein SHKM778_78050 [Streptomyces sp. KM77-8]|uniref:AMP-dependent synthetase/ligase domain-containing protein n=1 Tax=Streptomyces haneummycinicus TaxID=3074435 RepID=A0AAT9HW10_9ACTN
MSDTQTLIENRPPSVATLFLERVTATPDAEAYRYPVPAASGRGPDDWKSLTWAGAAEQVHAIAAGLIELGVEAEQRVALASSTRVEWILADLGILCAGAATTTVYPQTNADESAYILSDSQSRVLIAENAEQVAKAVEKRAELPELTRVVAVDPAGVETDDFVITLTDLEKLGAARLQKEPELIKERVAAITKDQLATLIYTSGTTGRPKGVRLPHDCWSYMAKATVATGLVNGDDVQYLWLPLAHVFGKVLTSGQIEVGHVTAVDGRVDKIIENLPAVRPTYMAGVPRIFEKVYNGVAAKAKAGGGAKYKIFQWAAAVAREYAKVTQDNFRRTGTASAPFALTAKHNLADKLVYAKIREAFGGNLRACVSGSAALAPRSATSSPAPASTSWRATASPSPPPHPLSTPARPTAPAPSASRCPAPRSVSPPTARSCCAVPASCRATTTCRRRPPRSWRRTAGSTPATSANSPPTATSASPTARRTSSRRPAASTSPPPRSRASSRPSARTSPTSSSTAPTGTTAPPSSPSTRPPSRPGPPRTAWRAGRTRRSSPRPPRSRWSTATSRQLNEGLQRWQTIKKFRLLPRDLDIEHGEITPSLKLKRPVVERTYKNLIEEMYEGTREA